MSLINTYVKPFKATAYHNGEFVEVSDETFKGQWSVLCFYPADFTFVCPTELEDLADLYDEFSSRGVEVYGISCDTHFAHKAWHDTSEAISKVKYPLIGDPTGTLARNFEVMVEDQGVALRGTFLLNPEGQIKLFEVNDEGIGRDANEIDLMIPIFAVAGDSEEEQAAMKARAKTQIAFYGSTPNYAFQFDDLGFEGVGPKLNQLMREGDIKELQDTITDEILGQFALVASWDDIADKLIERYQGVATRVITYLTAEDISKNPQNLPRWGEIARAVSSA